jgi:hypothetical protein
MRRFEMLPMVVFDDVGVSKGFEDLEFGVKLVLFPIRHAGVGDLFATEHSSILAPAHLSNDTE